VSSKSRTSVLSSTLRRITLGSNARFNYKKGFLSDNECYSCVAAEFDLDKNELRRTFDETRDSLQANDKLFRLIRKLKAESKDTVPECTLVFSQGLRLPWSLQLPASQDVPDSVDDSLNLSVGLRPTSYHLDCQRCQPEEWGAATDTPSNKSVPETNVTAIDVQVVVNATVSSDATSVATTRKRTLKNQADTSRFLAALGLQESAKDAAIEGTAHPTSSVVTYNVDACLDSCSGVADVVSVVLSIFRVESSPSCLCLWQALKPEACALRRHPDYHGEDALWWGAVVPRPRTFGVHPGQQRMDYVERGRPYRPGRVRPCFRSDLTMHWAKVVTLSLPSG